MNKDMDGYEKSSFSSYFEENDEKVELQLGATLRVTDASKFKLGMACVVYYREGERPFETESVWRAKTCTFTRKMSMIPKFQTRQMLRFVLSERTPDVRDIEEYRKFGDCELSLGQIMLRDQVDETLRGGAGDVRVKAQQVLVGRGILSMVIAFISMPKTHWLMKNYPQLVICKCEENGDWTPVFSSEVVHRSDAGQWQPISLPCRLLCDNDYKRKIRIMVQDNEPGNMTRAIGHVDVVVEKVGTFRNKQLKLIPAQKNMARAGAIIIRAADIVERLTFFAHLKQGLRFHFACGIDFAAANRPASDKKSLHYILFKHPNAYEKCIESIGEIVEQYSASQVCFAWGFSARINRQLSHEIPLVSETGQEKLLGVSSMLGAYASVVEKLQFDRPVCVLPSTMKAMRLITGQTKPHDYLVYLLLVQEDPSDLAQFIDYLHANQHQPISIVIIGIGNQGFPKMEERLREGQMKNGDGASFFRELVTFLKYKDFDSDNLAQMAATALDTVPEQAMQWVENNS